MHKVFVYGTLRKGHHNHHLLKTSRFLGNAHTGPGYMKVTKGLPYLLESDAGVGCDGELYEVSPLTLELLDRLEGNPDWYVRKMIAVKTNDGMVDAFVYIMPGDRI